MTFAEFKEKTEAIYRKKFPNSECKTYVYHCLGDSITIHLYLSKSVGECVNLIRGNDMFHITFNIVSTDRKIDKDNLSDDMEMTAVSNMYAIKPEIEYLWCGSRKVPFRKTVGNADKLLKAFEKYVDRLYNSIKEDIANNNIHPSYVSTVNDKI